jgi:hypothetical protein
MLVSRRYQAFDKPNLNEPAIKRPANEFAGNWKTGSSISGTCGEFLARLGVDLNAGFLMPF